MTNASISPTLARKLLYQDFISSPRLPPSSENGVISNRSGNSKFFISSVRLRLLSIVLHAEDMTISAPVAATRSRKSADFSRSEEHTSELQSQFHLVCRLLLEKKKK